MLIEINENLQFKVNENGDLWVNELLIRPEHLPELQRAVDAAERRAKHVTPD